MKPGDMVRFKKKHPCGGYEWQVARLGADIGLRCLKCRRHILIERATLERRVKAVITGPDSLPMAEGGL
ncbi:MAG: DUF951 domain-containing protein [Dehalococcoidales bacterium]